MFMWHRIGTIVLLFLMKVKIPVSAKALIFTLIIVVALQIRYLFVGYSLLWHIVVVTMHFLILYIVSLLILTFPSESVQFIAHL